MPKAPRLPPLPLPLAAAILTGLALTAVSAAEKALRLPDLEGGTVEPLEAPARAVVFLFAGTDCPISNRYAPEVRRLHARFAPQGVVFWLVYPDPVEPAEAIRRHLRDFRYRFGALRDPEHALVRLTGVTVTPEAAVFERAPAGPRMVYRGRIDDRYVEFGKARPSPTTRDLEAVLEAVARGSPLSSRTTPAVGCFIAAPE